MTWCHLFRKELRIRAYTRACPSFPSIFPLSPSPPLPYEACAAAGYSKREGIQRLGPDVAAAATVEQPRGCQRREPRASSSESAESAHRRDASEESSRTSPRAGGLGRSEQRARRPSDCRHLRRRFRTEYPSREDVCVSVVERMR